MLSTAFAAPAPQSAPSRPDRQPDLTWKYKQLRAAAESKSSLPCESAFRAVEQPV